MDAGYQALREGAAWLDVSARGRIRVTGEDRVRLLHAMVSNHVEQLRPGAGCYAFFLNAQGRILADVRLLCMEDSLLLDVEPETRQSVYEHLDRHIIADDVALEDVTEATFELAIEGPRAEEALGRSGAPVPEERWSHAAWGRRLVQRWNAFAIIGPRDERAAAIAQLEAAGAVAASADAARTVRLEQGRPRYGEDISDKNLPQETQLLEAIHFNKGCYLGQEIVERIRSRGGIHRFLTRIAIDGAEDVPAGTKVTAGGKEIGEITSAAWSPARGAVVALGYLRLGELPKDAEFEAAGRRASVNP